MRPVEETPLMPPPNSGPHATYLADLMRSLLRMFHQLGFRLNNTMPKIQESGDVEAMQGPLTLMTYLAAALPTASDFEGSVIYVSDGSAGQKFRGSDGTSWVNLG